MRLPFPLQNKCFVFSSKAYYENGPVKIAIFLIVIMPLKSREACPSSRLSLHVLPRDYRLQLLFSHFGRTHISLVEDRPGERRPGEISSLQIRTNQSSLGERRPGEISSLQIRITEVGPGEINSLQLSPAQISANEIGFSQPGLGEKSMRQVGSEGGIETRSYLHSGSVTPCFFHHHARLAQISASEIGSTEIDPSQVSFCEARLGQIGTREVGTIQRRLAQIRLPEIRFPEIHAAQIRMC